MRFFFDEPGTEGGFVWLRDEPSKNIVEVTTGYGSEIRRGNYSLPRRLSITSPMEPSEKEMFCRIAIASLLKSGGFVSQDSLDKHGLRWNGELRPVPPKM